MCNEVCVLFNSNNSIQHSNYNNNKLLEKEQLWQWTTGFYSLFTLKYSLEWVEGISI